MPWYVHFGVGFLVGGFFCSMLVDIVHSVFTNAAYKTTQYLAEQNFELYQELKQREGWEDEGEEWKNR